MIYLASVLLALLGGLFLWRRHRLRLALQFDSQAKKHPGFVPLESRVLPPTLWVRKTKQPLGNCAGVVLFGEPEHPLSVPFYDVSPSSDGSKSRYCAACAGKHLDEQVPPARRWWHFRIE
jgi:hypothetical protein